jgi:hypothetical protein
VVIVQHDRGLAASPPVRYILGVARSGYLLATAFVAHLHPSCQIQRSTLGSSGSINAHSPSSTSHGFKRATASRGGCPSTADDQSKEGTCSLPPLIYSAPGACGKPLVVLHNHQPKPEPTKIGVTIQVPVARGRVVGSAARRW